MDVVVHGDGEVVIQELLNALKEGASMANIPGISFWENGQVKTNSPEMLEVPDLNALPYPDFGLLKYYAKIRIYPIGRVRGCGMNCEFCSVRGNPHWASGQHLFNVVDWLIETREAREFFIVDDRLEEDLPGTLDFFRRISKKYGSRLSFVVQVRLEAAKNRHFLKAMREAGVRKVFIGFESPIDEDLRAMHKGYLSSHMLKWTKTFLRYGFWIHAMFIYGYPLKDKRTSLTAREITRRFKWFISKARVHTVQILQPIPIVGTGLRRRLKREKRIFPLEEVPWSKYDGNYVCFRLDNMTVRELQENPAAIMRWFYNPVSVVRIILKTASFPIDLLIRGFQPWHRSWWKEIVKYGGCRLLKQWQRRQKRSGFIERLEASQ